MGRDKRHQISLRHHQCHLVKQHFLASAPGSQIQAKVLLFHAIGAGNMRASVGINGGGFEHHPKFGVNLCNTWWLMPLANSSSPK
jgi:hypothetical protein